MSFVALVCGCLFLVCVKFKLQGLSFYLQAKCFDFSRYDYTHCLRSPRPVSLLILDICDVLPARAPIQHPNLNGKTPEAQE